MTTDEMTKINKTENPRIANGQIYYTCTGRCTKMTLCYEYKDGQVGKFIATGSFWLARAFCYLFGTILLVLCISQAMNDNINSSGLISGLLLAVLFLGFCPLMRALGKKICNDFVSGKKGCKPGF